MPSSITGAKAEPEQGELAVAEELPGALDEIGAVPSPPHQLRQGGKRRGGLAGDGVEPLGAEALDEPVGVAGAAHVGADRARRERTAAAIDRQDRLALRRYGERAHAPGEGPRIDLAKAGLGFRPDEVGVELEEARSRIGEGIASTGAGDFVSRAVEGDQLAAARPEIEPEKKVSHRRPGARALDAMRQRDPIRDRGAVMQGRNREIGDGVSRHRLDAADGLGGPACPRIGFDDLETVIGLEHRGAAGDRAVVLKEESIVVRHEGRDRLGELRAGRAAIGHQRDVADGGDELGEDVLRQLAPGGGIGGAEDRVAVRDAVDPRPLLVEFEVHEALGGGPAVAFDDLAVEIDADEDVGRHLALVEVGWRRPDAAVARPRADISLGSRDQSFLRHHLAAVDDLVLDRIVARHIACPSDCVLSEWVGGHCSGSRFLAISRSSSDVSRTMSFASG